MSKHQIIEEIISIFQNQKDSTHDLNDILSSLKMVFHAEDLSFVEMYSVYSIDIHQDIYDRLENGFVYFHEKDHNLYLPLQFKQKTIAYLIIKEPSDDIKSLYLADHLIMKLITFLWLDYMEHMSQNLSSELENHKHQILANISHEIKTPLSGIYNAFYLLGTTSLTNDQQEYMDIGQTSLDQLTNVIDDMLIVQKIEEGHLELDKDTFNLEDELIRIIKMNQKLASDQKIDLNFKFDNRISYELIGDYRKLRQVLLNLIQNGIKYTVKGSVTLDCNLVQEENDQVLIEFQVIDTGIGIRPKDQENITKQFFQVDTSKRRVYQGIGLGLSIASSLVSILNGKLTLTSKLKKGSTFSVTIPFIKGNTFTYPLAEQMDILLYTNQQTKSFLYPIFTSMGLHVYDKTTIHENKVDFICDENMNLSLSDINELKEKHGKDNCHLIQVYPLVFKEKDKREMVIEYPISRRTLYQRLINRLGHQNTNVQEFKDFMNAYVLIVDDNRLNRIALDNILKKFGIESAQASSGKEAIEKVKNEHFDMILMDIQMPEMDGFEATRRIRSLGKEEASIPIIAITANLFLKDYDVMKTSQINDVIFKPIQVEHLSQVLRKNIKPTKALSIPDDLFVFDQKDFEMRFDGSMDIALEVIDTFLEEYPKDLVKIETAINHKNPNEIYETTHYFKGSCSYLSAQRAVWILTDMMKKSKEEQLEHMKSYVLQLDKEIKSLVEKIKEYVK